MRSLPRGMVPISSNYSLKEPGGVLRTEVAGGAARYAMQWDRGPQIFNVLLMLDDLQFGMWTTFYHHAIRKGADSFSMPLDSGFGTSAHTVTIIPDSYSSARTESVLNAVTFQVEAENQAYLMSAADADAMLSFYDMAGDQSSDLLARLDRFANVDVNVLSFA